MRRSGNCELRRRDRRTLVFLIVFRNRRVKRDTRAGDETVKPSTRKPPVNLEARKRAFYFAETVEKLREVNGRLLLASLREEELKEQAQAANAAKSAFLATMSHE